MPRGERPLADGDSVLLGLAADLRRLREKAGSPTYRVLSARTHYSVAALSGAAAGHRLPSLAVTLSYVRACGGDAVEWERRWHEVATELAADEATEAGAPDEGRPPYAGLAAFQVEDAGRFFGRERVGEELLVRLSQRRVVAVFGASGAGKSSLLRAGLVARLREQGRRGLLLTPGPHPLEECAVHLAGLTGGTPGQLRAEILADPRNLHRLVRQALAEEPDASEVVLVVDQFEEVFTLCADQAERARFIEALLTAARAQNSRCRVVLGIRADFYGHCTSHPDLVEAIRDAQVVVSPMTADELRRAIVQPAVRADCTVEGALLATLVAHARGQVGVLPLLSHALLETWRRRRGNTLTLAGFQAAGGIDGALAQTAEGVYAALSPYQQRIARNLFLRLTVPGDGTDDTKRRIDRAELDTADPDVPLVLERLAGDRLVTLDRDSVEITHEALIRCWPRLRDWLADDREGLRLHRHLTDATGEWESLHRDPGVLYRGTRLDLVRDWAARNDAALTPREREFVDASLAAEADERAAARRRTRRLRQTVVLLAALLALATSATGYALRAQRAAAAQRDFALAEKVAGQAAALRDTNPALAAQLGLAAYRLVPTGQARSSLLDTFATPYATQLTGHTDNVNAVALAPDGRTLASASRDRTVRLWDVTDPHHPAGLATLTGHGENVNAVAFSPDGRTLASAGWDRTVRLWDVTDPHHPAGLAALTGHTDDVNAVAFAPQGRVLASAGTDHTVRLWDVATGRHPSPIATLTGHTDSVVSVVFNPDGRTLASASFDGTVRLWDVAGPAAVATLTGHTAPAVWAAFSPDGRTLATAGRDFTVRLWGVTDPRRPVELATLTGHTDVVRSVAFGPDGRTLATAGLDRTVRLWDVTDPRRPGPLPPLTGHTGAVVSVVFAPDGRTLATASDDYTVRLWDLPGPAPAGHDGLVCGAAFAPDGRTLATGGWDRTVRLWDVTDPRRPGRLATLAGHTDSVCGMAFSPDGRALATAGYDRTVRLWDVTDPHHPTPLHVLTGHTDNVNAVAFARDGRTLVTGGLDGTVRLWDVTDPRQPRELAVLTAHADGVNAVAVAPDGSTLASAGWDRTVRLWDVTDPRRPRQRAVLADHTNGVNAVAFAAHGRTLVSAGFDRTVRLWDVHDPDHPARLRTLTGHADTVYSVAVSPDGGALATASADHTVRLWDLTDPRRPAERATLTGHTDRTTIVAFAPDGHTVATGGADHTVRLWETDPDRVAVRVCDLAHPTITRTEWDQYFPGLPYRPPCPRR